MRGRLGAVVAQRPVIRLLVVRDLRLKYERSFLGYFWSLLEPLLLAGVYWFVFSRIARLDIPDYPLFIVTAIMPWLWVSGVINESTRALTGRDSRLVTTTGLPREVWAVRVVASKAVEFFLALPVIALFAIVMQHPPTRYLAAVVLAIVLQTMLLLGVAFFLSALNVIFGDVQRLTRVIVRLLFYMSPIVYDVYEVERRAGSEWARLYELNPLVGIFELYHAAWFGDRFPGWRPVFISIGVSIVLVVSGWYTFARLERHVLKEL
jgi:ABC-2 type transport system permease protein